MSPSPQLTVLVVGDTLDALICAAAFHSHGHHVYLFSSEDYSSSSATVQITPNAHDALSRLGISIPPDASMTVCSATGFSGSLEKFGRMCMDNDGSVWERPWIVVEESRLRQILLESLSSDKNRNSRVKIHQHTIKNMDLDAARVSLDDGTHVSGDLIIGADGGSSDVRAKMTPGTESSHTDTVSLNRLRIKRDDLGTCLGIVWLLKNEQEIVTLKRLDLRISLVPRLDRSTYDVVCYFPVRDRHSNQEEVKNGSEPGGSGGEEVMARLAQSAVPNTLSKQELPWAPVLFSQGNASAALIGSAAYSSVPIFGVDISSTIEDVAALVAVLSSEVLEANTLERLKLYDSIRHGRVLAIQRFSYDAATGSKNAHEVEAFQHLNSIFSHNAYDHAIQRAREYSWSSKPNLYWRIPVEFGPLPGPRQRHDGQLFASQHSNFVSASIRFKTSRSLLQNLLPPGREGFHFKSPGTVAYASFAQHTFSGLDWLGGGGYHLLGFYIHGVEYFGPDGEEFHGTHVPVLFESLADPILSGREELGMPKLYTAIDVDRDSKNLRVNASWQGASWGIITWTGLEEAQSSVPPPPPADPEDGLICWKYMPHVGKQAHGSADADYPILIPARDESCRSTVNRVWKAKDASISLDKKDWKALPTIHHIIARLQELPILEIVDARVVEGNGVPSALGARGIR